MSDGGIAVLVTIFVALVIFVIVRITKENEEEEYIWNTENQSDDTIVTVVENSRSKNTELTYCPYCNKSLHSILGNEDDKVFKIKEDGTIIRPDESAVHDKTDITYCPYCGKKLK